MKYRGIDTARMHFEGVLEVILENGFLTEVKDDAEIINILVNEVEKLQSEILKLSKKRNKHGQGTT